MASIINALSSGTGGIVTSGDASGILQLQTANTAAVTINGSQNVGIGTASPAAKLDIVGGSDILGLTNTSGSSYESINMTVGTQTARIVLTGQSFADANYGTGDLTIQAQTAGKGIRFGTGGSVNQMVIDSSGNISIGGTTSTVSKLNVTGTDNLNLYIKQNNIDNGWILGTSSVDGVFRVQRRGEGASPTNTERFSVQPDGQMFHNSTYLLGSSYNCYYGKSTSNGNNIVNSGFTNTGLSVANVYIPTNVRKVLMWFHVTLRANGIGINHTGFRIKMVRNSDSSTSYIGNSSWGIGICQPINTSQSQNWATVSQFVNLYDYDNDGNGAGITAGQTYTFYLMANDAYATGSQLRIGAEADGTHQTYTPQHAIIWVI